MLESTGLQRVGSCSLLLDRKIRKGAVKEVLFEDPTIEGWVGFHQAELTKVTERTKA